MPVETQPDFQPQQIATERILSDYFETSVKVSSIENLTPDRDWAVALRMQLTAKGDHIPTNVIVKHTVRDGQSPYDPEGSPFHKLANDYAGCVFLNPIQNDPHLAPKAYGFDREAAIVVMEEIPNDGQSLVQPLLEGDTSTAESALIQMMTRLGQLHAKTIGKADEYNTLRNGIDERPTSQYKMIADMYRSLGSTKLKEVFNAVEYTPDEAVWDEFNAIIDAIRDPRHFLSYVHYDPCPDNLLMSKGQLRIIDFEMSGFGHCLIDAVYPRMMFPSCWCANAVPMDVVEQLEDIYRAELVKACPQASDDGEFKRGIATACGFWLMNTLIIKLFWGDTPYDEDQRWGISSHHPRIIARLGRFAETAAQADIFPALQNMCEELGILLKKRWESAAEGLPIYPSFSASTRPN